MSDERKTIQEHADTLAKRDGRPSGEHYQEILTAIWLGELPIVHCYNGDRDQLFTPFTRDDLRMAVAAYGELNIGRTFMGTPVRATSKALHSALPFDALAKLPAQKYDKHFLDVYLDRLLIDTAAAEALFNKRKTPGRPPKEREAAKAALVKIYPSRTIPATHTNASIEAEVAKIIEPLRASEETIARAIEDLGFERLR